MNYSALLKGLLREAFAFRQYRRLPAPLLVLAIIAMLPFIILSACLLVVYAVYGFFFNLLASSVNYLESWLHRERKEVRHATEAVLYFVAAPTIFFLHVLLSLFGCLYYVVWFFLQCFVYVATLGGTRFQSNINTATYARGESDYGMVGSFAALVTFVSIAFGLLTVWAVFFIIGRVSMDSDIVATANVTDWIYTLFCAIAFPFCAKKRASASAGEDALDELPTDDEACDLELPEV